MEECATCKYWKRDEPVQSSPPSGSCEGLRMHVFTDSRPVVILSLGRRGPSAWKLQTPAHFCCKGYEPNAASEARRGETHGQ
jgi:hypothetical protein